MGSQKKYDVFISYRRNGGEGMARLLYERLVKLGYSVAYDIETLGNGRFDGELSRHIAGCKDFIVILSPYALDQCEREKCEKVTNDMMRQEIAFALKTERNVIPLLMDNFRFPDKPEDLPEDIRLLKFQNGVMADMNYFESALAKLCGRFKSKPRGRRIFRFMLYLALISALGCGIWLACHCFNLAIGTNDAALEDFLDGVSRQGTIANGILRAQRKFDEAMQFAAKGRSELDVALAYSAFTNALGQIRPEEFSLDADSLAATARLPVSKTDYKAMGELVRKEYESALSSARTLFGYVDAFGFSRPDDLHRLFLIHRGMYQADAKCHESGIMSLLRNIPDSKLESFKNETVVLWSELAGLHKPWIKNEADLKRLGESANKETEERVRDLEKFEAALEAECKLAPPTRKD